MTLRHSETYKNDFKYFLFKQLKHHIFMFNTIVLDFPTRGQITAKVTIPPPPKIEVEENKKVYKSQNLFILPEEEQKLINEVLTRTYLIMPTNQYAEGNLRTLKTVLGRSNAWVQKVTAKSINYNRDNAAMLNKWRNLLLTVGFPEVAEPISDMIDAAMVKLDLPLDESDKELMVATEKLFTTPAKKGGREILTEVRLTNTLAANIVHELGVMSPVYRMVSNASLLESNIEFEIHVKLVELLKQFGFIKESKKEVTFSKNALTDHLIKASPEELSRIKGVVQSSSDESLEVLEALNSALDYTRVGSTPAEQFHARLQAYRSVMKDFGSWAFVPKDQSPEEYEVWFAEATGVSSLRALKNGESYESWLAHTLPRDNESVKDFELRSSKASWTNLKSNDTYEQWEMILTSSLRNADAGSEIVQTKIAELRNTLRPLFFNKGNYSKVSTWIMDHFLSGAELLKKKTNASKLSKQANPMKLEEWQVRMINGMKDRVSFLASSPTGSGKTMIGFSGLEWILNIVNTLGSKFICLFCVPTPDLALQISNNLKKTFPKLSVSLFTPRESDIKSNPQVIVGTPVELWVYISTIKITFNLGIFDEIHTMSVSAGDSRADQLRAEAMANLLTLCPEQVIGLSATIHDEDLPVLEGFMKQQTGIRDISRIVERKRRVPQKHYQWDGDKFVSQTVNTPFVEAPVTPEATFKFLKLVADNDWAPALIFDENPEHCYKNYTEYIEWIQQVERANYTQWYDLKNTYRSQILAHNSSVNSMNDLHTESAKQEFKYADKPLKDFVESRHKLMNDLWMSIGRGIHLSLSNEEYRGILVPLSHKHQKMLVKIGEIMKFKAPTVGIQIPVEVPDLIDIFADYYEGRAPIPLKSQGSIASIKMICNSVGPYFRIGEYNEDVDIIRSIFDINSRQLNAEKMRSEMQNLCEAERIRETEITPLFKLLAKGLEYGVGIVLPIFPFAVHYNILKLLNKKNIKIIFASEDMSLGINYPIRLSCSRSNSPVEKNVSKKIQADGRAGRPGFDELGIVVSWNITNASTADQSTIPRFVLPRFGPEFGCQVPDVIKVAKEIEYGREYSSADDKDGAKNILDYGVKSMKYTHGTVKQNEEGGIKGKALKAAEAKIAERDQDEQVEEDEMSAQASTSVRRELRGSRLKDGEAVVMDVGSQEMALFSALSAGVSALAPVMGLEDEELLILFRRIQNIIQGNITSEMSERAYYWATRIGSVKSALQEIHTRLHMCKHEKFLDFIETLYELLHRVEFRQMRL
jgi:hypothetical protein